MNLASWRDSDWISGIWTVQPVRQTQASFELVLHFASVAPTVSIPSWVYTLKACSPPYCQYQTSQRVNKAGKSSHRPTATSTHS